MLRLKIFCVAVGDGTADANLRASGFRFMGGVDGGSVKRFYGGTFCYSICDLITVNLACRQCMHVEVILCRTL